jgi:hypothetical protein
MMVDAYQRSAEMFWYWVILFFQPLGAWVYFFAVKVRSLRLASRRSAISWQRRPSLDELRYRVERAPTLANRFALAERLMEKKAYTEAIPHLEAVLAIEPDYCVALHSLAACLLATGAAEQAIAPLEKLIHRDDRWANCRAWRTLIDVHHEVVPLLDQALEDHHYAPWSIRWRNWRWAREGRRLLAEAERDEKMKGQQGQLT